MEEDRHVFVGGEVGVSLEVRGGGGGGGETGGDETCQGLEDSCGAHEFVHLFDPVLSVCTILLWGG